METTKRTAVITFRLECPHCGESLHVCDQTAAWTSDCIAAVGYDNEYGDESKNLLVICGECNREFEVDGVSAPEIKPL